MLMDDTSISEGKWERFLFYCTLPKKKLGRMIDERPSELVGFKPLAYRFATDTAQASLFMESLSLSASSDSTIRWLLLAG